MIQNNPSVMIGDLSQSRIGLSGDEIMGRSCCSLLQTKIDYDVFLFFLGIGTFTDFFLEALEDFFFGAGFFREERIS